MFDPIVRSPPLIALYHLWASKGPGQLMPARRDFDPIDMVSLLPHLFLLDILPQPDAGARQFRYRLVGTAIVNLLGRDSTGKMADEALHGESTQGLHRIFNLVCDNKGPVATKGYIFYIREKNWIFVETLLLPLSGDAETVDMVLCGMVQVDPPAPQSQGWSVEADSVDALPDPIMKTFVGPVIDGVQRGRRDTGGS